jgi:aromatic-L-amino-acid decarboxylase
MIATGLGLDALRRIPTDGELRMRPADLARAITEDRARGHHPIAVVATVGTTSTTSIDPVSTIADICAREGVWLHVDAAYGGAAAILPSHAHVLAGADRADSLVINPHKWLFTPFDLSAFYSRRMDTLRHALSITPDYLRTEDGARNLMDTGIQLGRRFRALKLWMILRAFGAAGLREHIARHIQLAQRLAAWIDADSRFERLAPVPLSVVCFRLRPGSRSPAATDEATEALVRSVNETGEVFVTSTSVRGARAVRIAIGNLHTTEQHVRRAWQLIQQAAELL